MGGPDPVVPQEGNNITSLHVGLNWHGQDFSDPYGRFDTNVIEAFGEFLNSIYNTGLRTVDPPQGGVKSSSESEMEEEEEEEEEEGNDIDKEIEMSNNYVAGRMGGSQGMPPLYTQNNLPSTTLGMTALGGDVATSPQNIATPLQNVATPSQNVATPLQDVTTPPQHAALQPQNPVAHMHLSALPCSVPALDFTWDETGYFSNFTSMLQGDLNFPLGHLNPVANWN
ncbi:hypothetical protein PAXRUDRAFT_16491 [Paxillus rubicundulus Ve08.2h10]|uniref:Unplaced genomic scaffold scaffold_1546, whole genome shotgun sequence n=1 Tax=Paxillus rubicundulus Ve08.2h10 TaxID=930991 RepID=A0A0D0DLD3_9AGAM|nr:hypothetical protein PAXRUDRAFT_16491 [Paxillus rubicundulus Ve08.2h10]